MSKAIYLLGIFLGSMALPLQSQESINWDLLGKVTYEYDYNETFNQWIGKPSFPEKLKQLEGKSVKLSGYILPMDVEGEYYVLSAFPYISCFFCGGAGLESVMELDLKDESAKFSIDEYKSFVGILALNSGDFELTFKLIEAEIVSE
ncbi:MAG: DUF3299 domain-containing protein [Bacteroidota bacterium]